MHMRKALGITAIFRLYRTCGQLSCLCLNVAFLFIFQNPKQKFKVLY